MTFTLTGKSSVLSTSFFPPIKLEEDAHYFLGLIDFETFNSIPNVDETNNLFYYDDKGVLEFPVGSYEIEDIET